MMKCEFFTILLQKNFGSNQIMVKKKREKRIVHPDS